MSGFTSAMGFTSANNLAVCTSALLEVLPLPFPALLVCLVWLVGYFGMLGDCLLALSVVLFEPGVRPIQYIEGKRSIGEQSGW